MRSDAVIIVSIGFPNPAQMHFAQNNNVVHAFTPGRSDRPFHKAILPGRGWCGRLVADAHDAQSSRDDAAISRTRLEPCACRSTTFSASSRNFDLNGEARTARTKQSSLIAADANKQRSVAGQDWRKDRDPARSSRGKLEPPSFADLRQKRH